MTTLRGRRREDLQRRGLAPKTPPWSVAAVRQLAPYDRRPPAQLNAEARRQYCLSGRHEQNVAESTFRMHRDGLRVVYARPRPWPGFDLVRPRTPPTRPVVLRPQAGRDLLAWGKNPTAQLGRRLISACGLRLTAGTPLPVSDRDAQRRLVPGRCGPGGKDRGVPLAPRVLTW